MMEFVLGMIVGAVLTYLWKDSIADWETIGHLFKRAVERPNPNYEVIEYMGLPIPEKAKLLANEPAYGIYAKMRNGTGGLTVRKDTLQEAVDEAEDLNERYGLGRYSQEEEANA